MKFKSLIARCLSSVLLSGVAVFAAEGAPSKSFVQDRFAISFWVDPPMDEQAERRYQEIADANFSLVMGGFNARTPESIVKQLALSEKFGMKAVVWGNDQEVAQLPNGPACWGYMLRDEPSAPNFPELGKQVAEIKKLRPGKLSFINLLPSTGATVEQYGVPTYDEYLDQFIKVVKPEVLSMDHYPVFRSDQSSGRDVYCENLAYMRKHSLAAGIPFWNFFNVTPFATHTAPTEDQIRWQIYASLVYGSKGILYYCYYAPETTSPGTPCKGGGLIESDGRRTRHYYQAQRINQEVKNLGPTLMKLTSKGVYKIVSGKPEKPLAETPISSIRLSEPSDPPVDYLIGVFKHADGRQAVMINNYHFAYTAWPTIEFKVPIESVVEVDKNTGKETPLHDESTALSGLQLSFNAGEGRLFLVREGTK